MLFGRIIELYYEVFFVVRSLVKLRMNGGLRWFDFRSGFSFAILVCVFDFWEVGSGDIVICFVFVVSLVVF